jgi:GntR family phosphonate transport system transcriptional regulator
VLVVRKAQGVTLWRQIGEALIDEIDKGVFAPGERLPASSDLATRFRVNQHTVLRAISHLENEGVVRIERGRGTFVVESPIPYRMGLRTRFEQNLIELNLAPGRELIATLELEASERVAAELSIRPGDRVIMVALLGYADGIPLSYGLNYFRTDLTPQIGKVFERLSKGRAKHFSIANALHKVGIPDFRRSKIRIRAHQPSAEEARYLRMSLTESVMELLVTNVDAQGRPVMYASTLFCAARVELIFDPP